MKKLLPILLAVVGLVGGIGAGAFLKPAPEVVEAPACNPEKDDCGEGDNTANYAATAVMPAYDPDVVWDYVKMPKQFVIPIIKKERVSALVVLSLSLEVEQGTSDNVLARVPKLKDGFLQVLFAHANSGGFNGAFTTGQSMKDLRKSLNGVARQYLGDTVNDVLIEEIVKQES